MSAEALSELYQIYEDKFGQQSICNHAECLAILRATDRMGAERLENVLQMMHDRRGTGAKFAIQNPVDRPFTVMAAKAIGGHNALLVGRCPTCQGEIGTFRDELSRREFGISGMCQECQDSVFGKSDN